MEKSELAKSLIPLITPLVNLVSETFLKPKIQKIAKKIKLTGNNISHIYENKFNDYLIRSYEKYSIMNTIVFHNQQKLLKQLYIPLTVKNKDGISFQIDSFNKDFLPKYVRVLITDTAGMGKSTIMKKLFLSVVEECSGIPILIELRRISKSNDIVQEIKLQMNSLTDEIDNDFLLNVIKEGDFIFLFDGFDEIPESERTFVTESIHSFINKASDNQFLITSRPELALSSFGDFQEFTIEPLKRNEAYSLLNKYDNSGKLAPQLINKLKGKTNIEITEFLTNPLLVSLLYSAYEHKNTIPIKKHIFYRQVYDALFESHDLTKGDSFNREKFSKLDIDEFHRVLRHIGYNCLIKGKIEFSKDELLIIIKEAKLFSGNLNFKESNFLKDLVNTVPLFIIDGIYYKWSHKSIMEYFAAQFIYIDSKENQKYILRKIANHDDVERFINILDIYYSIDYKSFSEIIIYSILDDFFNHLTIKYQNIKNDYVNERLALTFYYDFLIFKKKFGANTSKALDGIWNQMKTSTAQPEGWSLLMSPVPDESNIDFLKVFVKPNPKSEILKFLFNKKERFVIDCSRKTNKILKIDIEQEKLIPLTDDEKLIFNTLENFKNTNDLILQYYGSKYFSIDPMEGKKYLENLEKNISRENFDKLLNF